VVRIAFIGLGKMGRPMAANLGRAGYDVRGFDLLPIARDDAAKDGVSIATSAKEALDCADVVVTMLPVPHHHRSEGHRSPLVGSTFLRFEKGRTLR